MPLPAILQALRLCSSDGSNMSEASPNERNAYLNRLQREREAQDRIAAEQSAQVSYTYFRPIADIQASHSASQLLIVEQRLTQAETNIQNLNETCHKLELYLEQYELINQELAAQVIDLQTNLKAT